MIVLVTGGASGLGESITRKIASHPAFTVYFTYNTSAVNAQSIEASFKNTFGIKCDFKNTDEVESLKNRIAEINPDVLVNNAYAGSFMKAHFHKTPPQDFLTEFNDNIIPTITVTQACINSFRKKKSGKIVTVLTSGLLSVPPAGSAIYVANKAYMKQLTKVWAAENAKYNITSNTVSPSFMQTSFTKEIDERLVSQMEENHPLKKLLTTQEVAESIWFLVNSSNHINGVDIPINAAADLS